MIEKKLLVNVWYVNVDNSLEGSSLNVFTHVTYRSNDLKTCQCLQITLDFKHSSISIKKSNRKPLNDIYFKGVHVECFEDAFFSTHEELMLTKL